jgi:hypothetical protein
VNDRPARGTPGTGDGRVWTGVAIGQLQWSGPALDGIDLLDSEFLDSPWDDLSGGTTHVSGHAVVVPRNTIYFGTL